MTTDELNAIVKAVMDELEKAGVDFDFKAETPQADDLVYVMRGTSDNYKGITVRWQNLLDIIVKKATDAKDEAVSAKDIALQTLATIQGIESNVNLMKSSVDASEANVASMKASVEASEARVTQIKAEAEQTLAEATQTVSGKADKTYVDGELAKKADITYVDNGLTTKTDITYVDGKLATKADKSELAVERARIDSLSKLSEGSTTGDAELIDLRIGADGVTYGNAGTAVRTQISDLKGDLTEISESSSEPTVIELHPTKNSGYHWGGSAVPSSSYFYFHVNVKEGDVVSIPLTISGNALQMFKFIDAYNGDVRNNEASHNPSSPDAAKEYTVPKNVDNIYISINFRQDFYEYYYVSILRTVEELKPKGISDLTNRVSVLENVIVETKNGYTLKKEISNLASGSMITLSEHIDNKKNKSYRFSAKFNTFSSVTVGHGYNVYGGSWVTVDNTNVTAYYYNGSQAVQMGQYAHGLTISDFIDVVITVGNIENVRAVVTVMSASGDFTQSNIPMAGCNGSVFAFGGQDLIDVVYSYNLADMLSDIWLFGDSYTSLGDPNRWTYQLMQYGYKDILMCGFSGATSSNEILAFREIMEIGKPKIVVWALGMNDADNGQVNQTWLACVNEVISFCRDNDIELVLATIPCTPRVDNSYKNAYIRESTYRYIDFAKAVNGESVGATWYSGMLSSDNVHPITLGAKALANRFILDMPEIIKN